MYIISCEGFDAVDVY